jgi:hypothetical protein
MSDIGFTLGGHRKSPDRKPGRSLPKWSRTLDVPGLCVVTPRETLVSFAKFVFYSNPA